MKVSTLFIIIFLFAATAPRVIPQRASDVQAAWDALIDAKAGRLRLSKVQSVVAEFSGVTRLTVLPDRQWEFNPDIFRDAEPNLIVKDGRKGQYYLASITGITESGQDDINDWLPSQVLPFMLETKWHKPELIRVYRTKEGKKSLDVIETMVNGNQLDFVYEPEEMMVRQVRFHSAKYNNAVWQVYSFSEYVDVDGIKMPKVWTHQSGFSPKQFSRVEHTPISFKFNVDYDPKIFEPPFMATTPDAWKKKLTTVNN